MPVARKFQTNNAPFWYVFCPTGGPPRMKHDSSYSARAEACRLSRANPDKEFLVLRCEASFIHKSIVKTTLQFVKKEY